jgi:hypothetical protein
MPLDPGLIRGGLMTIWLWGCLVLACLAAFLELVARAGVIEVGKIDSPLDSSEKPDQQDDTPDQGGHTP